MQKKLDLNELEIKKKWEGLPKDFQKAEALLRYDLIDEIVQRKDLKSKLIQILKETNMLNKNAIS